VRFRAHGPFHLGAVDLNDRPYWPPLSPTATGLGAKCPRCGRGKLLKGLLDVRERCEVCNLDLSPHDTGDGATVFVILFLGAIVVGLAVWLEFAFSPPVWVHLVVWIPVITIMSVAMLRPFKGILIALHFRNLRHKYGSDRDAE
jgi:uncharacterized protein (DUF983 family)